jgi:hypothetical protein
MDYGAEPASYTMGTGGNLGGGGVKRPGRKAYYSLPYIADVRNGGTIPTVPPYTFMEKCLFN